MGDQTVPPEAPTTQADFLVVGGGIAGASVAYFLAPHGRVILLERESQPGYHATGRSAAMFVASYGCAQVRALSKASWPFFQSPPAGFADHPLVQPRGSLTVAAPGEQLRLDAMLREIQAAGSRARRLNADEAVALVPVLRPERVAAAVYEPDAYDIDVHALHQGFLGGLRRSGGCVVCHAEVQKLRREGERWLAWTPEGRFEAPVLLNAAGAWADELAAMAGVAPIGLEPRRRSTFVFSPPADQAWAHWPLVLSLAEDWYFKPDAGVILGSPANADPTHPQDVQPEAWDIALGVHRLTEATTLDIQRPQRPWAGLRSFVADGGLVGGMDPTVPGFVWVAAQGGYGMQTSPAMGLACAALARGLPLPANVAAEGLDAQVLGPSRRAPSTIATPTSGATR